MAILYTDPRISASDESDSFDGGFGTGALRRTWAGHTGAASSDKYYGAAGTEAIMTGSGILLGTSGEFHTYGAGDQRHILNGTAITGTGYTLRLAGTNSLAEDVDIIQPTAAANGIQVGSGGSNVILRRFSVRGPGMGASVAANIAVLIATVNTLTISDFEISNANTGIGAAIGGDLVGTWDIGHGVIKSLSSTSPGHSDCITVGGTIRNYAYRAHFHDLELSGCAENALDLVGALRVLVSRVKAFSPNRSVGASANGILLGSDTGTAGHHILTSCEVYGFDSAFSARGGVGCLLQGCIGVGVNNGFVIGTGTPNDHRVYNSVMVGGNAGIRVGGDANSSGHIFRNTIAIGQIGILVDAGSTATLSHCASSGTLASGGGITNQGSNVEGVDLKLSADYRPGSDSPCKGAGVYIPGAKHFGGHSMSAVSPDIGARRYFAPRGTVTRVA
jgi:hypothetical protein